jgi:DNA (cytosine-5)-methyltransferase 1
MMGLIVDNFAGGGGASTGIEAALGRAVDIAINHDEQAIRMHEVNHPRTRHIRNNLWQIDPREATGGQHVDLAWFSPDCKHFSKAKGGKPREKSIRDLAWVVVLWAEKVRPDVILLENVEEFRTWGPLDDAGFPIKERAGETFDKWCRQLRKTGYKLQFRELRACDYGAPTIRKRFFMVARCDGKPIVWPEPTHAKPGSPEVVSGKRKAWRTAAEIIDWSIPCPSIFERKKPLAEKTLRRIAHGVMKFVVNNPKPFIVGTAFKNTRASRAFDIDEPLRTATAQPEYGVVVPHVTKFREGAIGHGIDEPLHTVTANSYVKRPGGSAPLGLVEATAVPFTTYAQHGGGNRCRPEQLRRTPVSSPPSCRSSLRTGKASIQPNPFIRSWLARRDMLSWRRISLSSARREKVANSIPAIASTNPSPPSSRKGRCRPSWRRTSSSCAAPARMARRRTNRSTPSALAARIWARCARS